MQLLEEELHWDLESKRVLQVEGSEVQEDQEVLGDMAVGKEVHAEGPEGLDHHAN